MKGIQLIRLPSERTEEQMIALQELFAAAPDYCMRVIGHIPGVDEMHGPRSLLERPRKTTTSLASISHRK